MDDPFIYHPGLRGKIIEPHTSFFRDFNAQVFFAERPDLVWVRDLMRSDEDHAKTRADALARHEDGDIWVFAYGSLMWDPALNFREVRRARLEGFNRQFILKDIFGSRGTREQPGLMAALDSGGSCDGLVFRIAQEDIAEETKILWRREMIIPSYVAQFMPVQVGDEQIEALVLIADHASDHILPNLSHSEQVRFIATGQGFLGSSCEYLENIVDHFATLGIVDDACSTLLSDVKSYAAAPGVHSNG